MINNLTPEEKLDWDRRMKKAIRRQERIAAYKLIRSIAYLVALIGTVVIVFRSCNPEMPVRADRPVDTAYFEHLREQAPPSDPITSDTASPETQRKYDSLIKTEQEKGREAR